MKKWFSLAFACVVMLSACAVAEGWNTFDAPQTQSDTQFVQQSALVALKLSGTLYPDCEQRFLSGDKVFEVLHRTCNGIPTWEFRVAAGLRAKAQTVLTDLIGFLVAEGCSGSNTCFYEVKALKNGKHLLTLHYRVNLSEGTAVLEISANGKVQIIRETHTDLPS
ncbi:MAG: hypothetical protein HC848_09730 [Limnobacter sp.]|nr:hypothetical protein [Limnobacter sp.]